MAKKPNKVHDFISGWLLQQQTSVNLDQTLCMHLYQDSFLRIMDKFQQIVDISEMFFVYISYVRELVVEILQINIK